MKWLAITLAVVCVGAAACVDKEGGDKADPSFIQSNLLASAPTPQHAVNADLGGKVTYLGCDVDHETAAIGDHVKVVHYWKVNEAPGPDWKLFTHVNGSAGDWINVDDTRMRKQYGPEKWKSGDIIRDEQVFPVLARWKSPDATVYVGMYRRGGQTEKDRMTVASGPNDGHGRVEVVKIPIAAAGGRAATAGYVVRRASGKIVVDGKGDEPDWASAPSTGPFKTAQNGGEPGGSASAKLLWDDQNLYALVEVVDADVASQFTKHDEPLWKEDAVELFIDADKNGHGYVELQVNPRNATFDSWFATVRPDGNDKWDSGMVTAVTVDGTLDKRDDVDKGWRAELAIPLKAVKGEDDKMDVRLPPRAGDTWKLDIVRVEKPKDGAVTASAWAAIDVSDFHALDRLVTVTFGDATGKTEAPPADAKVAPATAAKPAEAKGGADAKPVPKAAPKHK
jgi:hypothetical protein